MTAISAPAFLAPDYRYAGDAWLGTNALTYVVWQTPPLLAADGVTVVTPGVPLPLTGCTVSGTLSYQSSVICGPTPAPASPALPAPIGAIVDLANAVISLSLPAGQTAFPRQNFALWGTPNRALLLVQPRILDANGNPVTVGLQQLFVF